jgi:hypothetical protein
MSPHCPDGRNVGRQAIRVNWGSAQIFIALIKRFHCFPTTAKRDYFGYLKRSLSIYHIMASGDTVCPLGTSNARHVATLAGLKTHRKGYTTTGENRKTGPGPFLRP